MTSGDRDQMAKFMDSRCFGYTIYENPSDEPGHYVVRGWDIEHGETIHSAEAIAVPISDFALKVLRETLREMGLVCIGKSEHDDEVIVESWI